jgi:malonate transporter MadL subunit
MISLPSSAVNVYGYFCLHNARWRNQGDQHDVATPGTISPETLRLLGREERKQAMVIAGVALLAICTLAGSFLGDLLGLALGVKANVGGVGLAMVLLITVRSWLQRRKFLGEGVKLGVGFWGSMYIPIVVAMAADQNVAAAMQSGPMVIVGAVGAVVICFIAVAIIGRLSGPTETIDEIEAREGALTPAMSKRDDLEGLAK